ncbi:hypothetical protein ANN_26832 [Periplaneta americana]|uniref:DUF4817 domain-containing protein n=1 Tax=Periplaneta americana TaxID=6978 RepID=A0ABQ8RZ55_PERAM|nr:hypothetical protein ANN_26832 [Periplaneta americana]
MYSNQELAEIHFMYGKADGNAALARRLYQRYPQRQCPDRKTFVRLHYRLCEYGKFNSPGLGRGRPRSTTPEVQEEILEAVNMTPPITTRRVALQVNVPHTTVWRLLKEYQLYPYHLQHVQALSPADYPARVRFCQWFLQQCDVSFATCRSVKDYTSWGSVSGSCSSVVSSELSCLKTSIPHVLEETPLINRQHIHFLHDGAPAHFSRTARRYLDRRFHDRWIGRGGPIAWPPRSPDLNPLDFYLWGHLKSLVYSSPVPDLESLRNRIVACSEDIRNTPGVWDRVRRSMRHRCEVCIQAGGGHFEHLLLETFGPLGRPRRKWEDNIIMDLREVGYDDREWINLAQFKSQFMPSFTPNDRVNVRNQRLTWLEERCDARSSIHQISVAASCHNMITRLRWAGHVARMGESRNAYRVLVGRPEGKRPLGMPRRRWEDNIKMDLRELGYDDRDWINLAQDRDRWRAYVRAAMNLRSLMLAGNEFQSLGKAIVKEDEYEEVRWDGIVSIVSWRERVFILWWEERFL